jgi:hypothetical protein
MCGGSVIFDSLAVGLVGSAVLAHAPVRTPLQPIGARLFEGLLHNKLALLLALVRRNYIQKNSFTSRDGRV